MGGVVNLVDKDHIAPWFQDPQGSHRIPDITLRKEKTTKRTVFWVTMIKYFKTFYVFDNFNRYCTVYVMNTPHLNV